MLKSTQNRQGEGRAQRGPFPLVLGIKRRLSRRNDPAADEADRVFQQMRPKVLMRDQYTCRACGFASIHDAQAPGGFLEVHHIDDDHHHNEMNNLVTLCPFCHQVFTMGRRGDRFGGFPVWLPEISQADLNLLCHAMFFVMRVSEMANDDSPLSDAVEGHCAHVTYIYHQLVSEGDQRLQALSTPLTKFDSLETLSGAMSGLNDHEYSKRHLFLQGLRIVPDSNEFQKHIAYWTEHVWLRGVKPDGWGVLIRQVASAIELSIPQR